MRAVLAGSTLHSPCACPYTLLSVHQVGMRGLTPSPAPAAADHANGAQSSLGVSGELSVHQQAPISAGEPRAVGWRWLPALLQAG